MHVVLNDFRGTFTVKAGTVVETDARVQELERHGVAMIEIKSGKEDLVRIAMRQFQRSRGVLGDYVGESDVLGILMGGGYADTGGGLTSAVGPAGAIQFSDGTGDFEGTGNATVDALGNLESTSVATANASLSASGVVTGTALETPNATIDSAGNVDATSLTTPNATLDDDGKLTIVEIESASASLSADGDLTVKTASFPGEADAGNSGAGAFNIDFATLGQKVKATLTGNATLTLTFPGVGNYVLRWVQNNVGGHIPDLPATLFARDGLIKLDTAADAETIWSIYFNGTNAYVSSDPSMLPAEVDPI